MGHFATHNDVRFFASADQTICIRFTPLGHYLSKSPRVTVSDPQHLPFIFSPSFSGTVLELLSIADQYDDVDQAKYPTLHFPSKLAVYDFQSSITSWRSQWATFAHIGGAKILGFPDDTMASTCGLTQNDAHKFFCELSRGVKIEHILR